MLVADARDLVIASSRPTAARDSRAAIAKNKWNAREGRGARHLP